MKKTVTLFFALVLSMLMVLPVAYAADDMAKKLNDALSKAPAEKFWQIPADDVLAMINAKKTDFLVVDVRPNPAEFAQGRIPGAIQMSVQDVLKPESLKKLPKDKKLILVCVTGQTQNLPIIALRALGYNAYTMSFGMASWSKGYHGAQKMQDAIKGAETKNYPISK